MSLREIVLSGSTLQRVALGAFVIAILSALSVCVSATLCLIESRFRGLMFDQGLIVLLVGAVVSPAGVMILRSQHDHDKVSLPNRFGRYSLKQDEWIEIESQESDVQVDVLTFVSWNIMNGDDIESVASRTHLLLRELEAVSADIVALEEVNIDSLKLILGNTFIRHNYFASDIHGKVFEDSFDGAGVLLLSKLHPSHLVYVSGRIPDYEGHRLISAELQLNEEPVTITVLSLHHAPTEDVHLKEKQLAVATLASKETHELFLLGDLGFVPTDTLLRELGLTDPVKDFYGEQSVNTFDPIMNSLAQEGTLNSEEGGDRTDVILQRIPKGTAKIPFLWKLVDVKLLGKESPFASDHFGLMGKFLHRPAP